MFIPYRAKIKITRIPVMTILVTVFCLLIYWSQEKSDTRILQSADAFCTDQVAMDLGKAQREYIKSSMPCREILAHIYSDGEKHLDWHVKVIEEKGDFEAASVLVRHVQAFAAQAPTDLTGSLVHHSGSWNPLRLLSSTVAHADWNHVIGNLFFFVAFAMVVETVIGPVLFLLVFLTMGLGTGALENLMTATREGSTSLGLSGVVMSMMTLAAYLAPKVKIKFFYFYFLFFGVLSWPLWSVAGWYVFWNLWDIHFWRDWSNVNYAAHLTGAAMGLIIGVLIFRKKRHWVTEQIVVDEPTLSDDDESWLSKLNAYGAAPVVMGFVFLYGFFALMIGAYLFVTFITTFAVQLLIAAPVVAGAMQIYRMVRGPMPPWSATRRAWRHSMHIISWRHSGY